MPVSTFNYLCDERLFCEPVLLVIVFILERIELLAPKAARSKACSQSSAEIAGLSPARSMDVCLL